MFALKFNTQLRQHKYLLSLISWYYQQEPTYISKHNYKNDANIPTYLFSNISVKWNNFKVSKYVIPQ